MSHESADIRDNGEYQATLPHGTADRTAVASHGMHRIVLAASRAYPNSDCFHSCPHGDSAAFTNPNSVWRSVCLAWTPSTNMLTQLDPHAQNHQPGVCTNGWSWTSMGWWDHYLQTGPPRACLGSRGCPSLSLSEWMGAQALVGGGNPLAWKRDDSWCQSQHGCSSLSRRGICISCEYPDDPGLGSQRSNRFEPGCQPRCSMDPISRRLNRARRGMLLPGNHLAKRELAPHLCCWFGTQLLVKRGAPSISALHHLPVVCGLRKCRNRLSAEGG